MARLMLAKIQPQLIFSVLSTGPVRPLRTDLVQTGTKGEILHFSGTILGKMEKHP